MITDELIAKYTLVSNQIEIPELKVLLNELEKTIRADVKGDVVEFGCYVGTTSLFITRMLERLAPEKSFHVYDSFNGLPEKTEADLSPAGMQFRAGELSAAKTIFIQNFKKAGLKLPVIHKSWFAELLPNDIPAEIGFAFLDGDYYESVRTPLRLIEKRLTPGAVIIVDDYHNEALPGAAKAVDEWIANRSYKSFRVESSLAVLCV